MPAKTPQPGGGRRRAFPHVASLRLDAESYQWLESVAQELGHELAIATLCRYAVQWAHWIQVDMETRYPKRVDAHGFAAYVRSEESGEA